MTKLHVHGAVLPNDPSQVYLRAEDIIGGLRSYLKEIRDRMAAVSGEKLLDQAEILRYAAMVGATEVLEDYADAVDILSMEFSNDANGLADDKPE